MYYLVLLALLQLDTVVPAFVAAPTDQATCQAKAQSLNANDPGLRSEAGQQAGAGYVCLKMEYAV